MHRKRKRPPEAVERALEAVAPEYRPSERWHRRVLRWVLVASLAIATGWMVVKLLVEARPYMPKPKPPPVMIDLVRPAN